MQIPCHIAKSYNINFLTDLQPATEQKFDMAMIVVDRFSQRVFVIPTWKIAAEPMCAEQFHDEITCRNVCGVPRELISDRDVRFISTSVKKTHVGRLFSGVWARARGLLLQEIRQRTEVQSEP
jgi:hypothetical protein